MSNLADIGRKYGTDKVGPHVHTFNGFCYLDFYERHFCHLKEQKVNFLELGVLNGASLRTWEEYFVYGNIIGLDIDKSRSIHETERIKIYIGSQTDKMIINKIKQDYPDGFDIVLDDASHLNELTLQSFDLLFDHVKPGGYYIIEDTQCTYGSEFYGESFAPGAKQWPGMHLNNPEVNYNNSRADFNPFILEKIKKLDSKNGNIFSMTFYSETLIIEKIR